MAANIVDRELLGGTHPVLDLGEGLFDRIEVWRVWRLVPESGGGGLIRLRRTADFWLPSCLRGQPDRFRSEIVAATGPADAAEYH